MLDKRYTFRVKENTLYLVYSSEDVNWPFGNLHLSGSTCLIGKVFTVTEGEIVNEVKIWEEKQSFQ